MKNLDAEIRVAEEFQSMIVKNIQLRRRMVEKEQMKIKIKEAKEKEKEAAEASEAKKIKVEKLDREFQSQYEFTLLQVELKYYLHKYELSFILLVNHFILLMNF